MGGASAGGFGGWMVDPFGGIAPGFLGGGNEGDVTSTSFEERDASRESDSG